MKEITQLAEACPWRIMLVGGYVRDMVHGIPPKDIDVEVYGDFHIEELVAFLKTQGRVDAVGQSFGVLKLRMGDTDIDVSIPRRESKSGQGHKGFIVEPDPTISMEEAASRRDFTMNAMLLNPLTGELLDYFGGSDDMARGILRHTSSAFGEDPLRVLRGFQFCGRFGLYAASETLVLCRSLLPEYDALATERIWDEWAKWAVKSTKPAYGLRFLRDTGWLSKYPELERLIGCMQELDRHPEGDVWQHTLHCVDAAPPDLVLRLAMLLHDVAKPQCLGRDTDGRITTHGHHSFGADMAKMFLARIGAPLDVANQVVPLVREHMAHISFFTGGTITERTARRLAQRLHPANIDQWGQVVGADMAGRPPLPGGLPAAAQQIIAYAEAEKCTAAPVLPLLRGLDALDLGMIPGPPVGKVLRAGLEAQLDGVFTDRPGALAWIENMVRYGGYNG